MRSIIYKIVSVLLFIGAIIAIFNVLSLISSGELPSYSSIAFICFIFYCLLTCLGAVLLWRNTKWGKRLITFSLVIQIPAFLSHTFSFYVNLPVYFLVVLVGDEFISIQQKVFIGMGFGSGYPIHSPLFGLNIVPIVLLCLLVWAFQKENKILEQQQSRADLPHTRVD
jgi:protein-S-isoprenylcysteine O-methyltransferase Ste14